MELEEAYGVVLLAARKQLGLSQYKLAEQSGVSRTHISMLELGRNGPTLGMLYKLAEALGQTASAMLAQVDKLIQGGKEKPKANRPLPSNGGRSRS